MAKKGTITREQRRIRTQQIIFSVIAVLVILSWILALISK
jgi:predicted nucleic acid-binding Zn ribbon protein